VVFPDLFGLLHLRQESIHIGTAVDCGGQLFNGDLTVISDRPGAVGFLLLNQLGTIVSKANGPRNDGVGICPLGQGLSIANGIALAARLDELPIRIYCLMGDGETDEGQVWEAAIRSVMFISA
jgi:hypothetical protein